MLTTARRGLRDGLSAPAAARHCPLDSFADLPDEQRTVRNLRRAYADELGGALDLIGALTDAVALNHGPMRTAV